jgi:hypothetical protein
LFSSHGFFPLFAMALGFFEGGRRKEVKWWKCERVDLQSTRGLFLLALKVHWEWWLASAHWWEYQTTGFSLGAKGLFNEIVFMIPEWRFSANSAPRGKSLCVFV